MAGDCPSGTMQEARWAYAGSGLVLYGELAGIMREADSYHTMSALGLHGNRVNTIRGTRSDYGGTRFPHTLCAFPDLWK